MNPLTFDNFECSLGSSLTYLWYGVSLRAAAFARDGHTPKMRPWIDTIPEPRHLPARSWKRRESALRGSFTSTGPGKKRFDGAIDGEAGAFGGASVDIMLLVWG